MKTNNPETLPRRVPMTVSEGHLVNGNPIVGPFSKHLEKAVFGMGCFWGAEGMFWDLEGVHVTAVGYAGGHLMHPTYRGVCARDSGHAEVVLVVNDPAVIGYERLLRSFWEGHDPTQGSRQGNDVGLQYRSVIFATSESQANAAKLSMERFAEQLTLSGHDSITTEIELLPTFYYAEEEHQQYLAKHPAGYCGLGGTGVRYPIERGA